MDNVIEEKVYQLKKSQLESMASMRENLRKRPELEWLFFELTNRCNLACAHCGSRCISKGINLSLEDVENTLKTLSNKNTAICLTGGEPLLHPDFFLIAHKVIDMGFHWGMTSNGTLIDDEIAQKIRQAGMSTISISLDGMEASHDKLRHKKGAWREAVNGIKCLQKVGYEPQVTSVFHSGNINELDNTYSFLCNLGITSWRPINVEPIGRACESSEMMLSKEQFKYLIDFIRTKRFDHDCPMEVTFGCSHYLGIPMERMVRNHYFFCGAGITVASVHSNGDIGACLDIDNRPSLVQGNIHKDNFWDVWLNQFKVFRSDRTTLSHECSNCSEKWICGGDSTHTWNWDLNEPLLCGKKMLE